MVMTKGQPTITATTQGVTALDAALLGRQFETRYGLLAGAPRTLWDDANPPTPTPTPAAPAAPATPDWGAEIAKGLQNLIGKAGSSDKASELLYNDNKELRDKLRDTRAKLPTEGSVVLTAEEAKAWEAYRQLDADPAKLQERLASGEKALDSERGRELAGIAKADPTVLMDRLKFHGLTAKIEGEAPKQGEQDKRTVHLLDKDGKDQGEAREWFSKNDPKYTAALFPQATPQGGTVINGQAGAGASSNGTTNPVTAALQGNRPTSPAPVVSAFDFKPSQSTGGNA